MQDGAGEGGVESAGEQWRVISIYAMVNIHHATHYPAL